MLLLACESLPLTWNGSCVCVCSKPGKATKAAAPFVSSKAPPLAVVSAAAPGNQSGQSLNRHDGLGLEGGGVIQAGGRDSDGWQAAPRAPPPGPPTAPTSVYPSYYREPGGVGSSGYSGFVDSGSGHYGSAPDMRYTGRGYAGLQPM